MQGISSPICHKTEFVADFLDDPVPTTSPTKTNGFPFSFNFSIVPNGSSKPVLGILNIASEWRGISGLDHASGAGDKSSVLISPDTLNTVNLIFSLMSSFSVNHFASAHSSITFFAYLLFLDISKISLKASKINKVLPKTFEAVSANSSISRHLIRGSTLYPPSIVPRISTASFFEI